MGPKPQITPIETGAISERWRKASRAWTFDRWISTVGAPLPEMASRRATDV